MKRKKKVGMTLGESMKTEQLEDRRTLQKRGMMGQSENGGPGLGAW